MRLTEDQSNDVTVTLPSAIDGLVTVGHKPGPGRNWPCMAATSGCRSSGGNRAAHRRTVRAFGSGATSRNSMEGLKSTRGKPGSSNVERPTDHSPPSPRSISRALRRRHPAHVRRQWQGTHRTSWLRTILTLRPAASGRTASTTRRGRQGLGSSERAGRRGGGGGAMQPSTAATHASRELETAFFRHCRTGLRRSPPPRPYRTPTSA